MKIDIRDDISPEIALKLVLEVVKFGKVSKGEDGIDYVVSTRQYRKSDCFIVYKR